MEADIGYSEDRKDTKRRRGETAATDADEEEAVADS
ncbi:hypothetical protein SAMN05192561_102152 [Halopenitus malekzadehii]|uniref:Uncharacterized protein n=1 Tax=Halopenitus malekzadehii TaxID=1267564 RepID=A0A1H6IEU4_9EURY|nr:hypothetical protein SAMN05192561_102152 [Halopenitus malekzadehii]